jgi:hypothetical protein
MEEADYTELDRRIAALGDRFADGIKELASSPAVQRGLLAAALSDLVWTLYIAFADDRDMLHDELASLAAAVRSASEEHRDMATSDPQPS